jgi:hypothetical protein
MVFLINDRFFGVREDVIEHISQVTSDTPLAMFFIWQVTFDNISTRKPSSAEVLSHMAFFAWNSTPASLLRLENEEQAIFTVTMGTLKASCIVSEDHCLGSYRIYRLVHECTQVLLESSRHSR